MKLPDKQNVRNQVGSKLAIHKAAAFSLVASCGWAIAPQAGLAQATAPPTKSTANPGVSTGAVQNGLSFYVTAPLSEQELKSMDGTPREFAATVPLIVDAKRKRLFVEVLIGKRKTRLMVDTGGGDGITLNKAAAKGIPLKYPSSSRLHGLQGYEAVTRGVANSMTFGPLTLRAIDAAVMDGASPDGLCILGTQAFERYRVTMDFTANTLTLSRGGVPMTAANGDASLSLPFRDEHNSILVPIRLLGQSSWACLDSGCEVSVMSLTVAKEAAAQIPPGESKIRVNKGRYGLGDTDKSTTMLVLARAVPISLVSDSVSSPANLTDFSTTSQVGLSVFEDEMHLASNVPTDVLLGEAFFLQFHRVIIDYPNHLLILQGPKHGAPLNMFASSPVPGKSWKYAPSLVPGTPWPGYSWQRCGDGWVEVADKSQTVVPDVPLPVATATQTTTTVTTVSEPGMTTITTTSQTGMITTVRQPNHGNVTVITNGITSEYPLGSTVDVGGDGKVQVLPPADAGMKK